MTNPLLSWTLQRSGGCQDLRRTFGDWICGKADRSAPTAKFRDRAGRPGDGIRRPWPCQAGNRRKGDLCLSGAKRDLRESDRVLQVSDLSQILSLNRCPVERN